MKEERTQDERLSCINDKDLGEGTSLEAQRLRRCPSAAGGTGLIPGRGTKIPQAIQHGQ